MKKIVVNGIDFLKSQDLSNTTFKKCNIIDNIVEINSNETYFQPTKEDTFRPEGNTWEIGVKVKTSGFISNSQVLFGSNTAGKFYLMPSVEIQSTGVLWAGISQNGTSWDLSISSEKQIPLNVWCYIKYIYDKTNYTVLLSTDNLNWETYISLEGSIIANCTSNLEFGGIALSGYHYARNTKFDLNNIYIKVNDSLIWGNKED